MDSLINLTVKTHEKNLVATPKYEMLERRHAHTLRKNVGLDWQQKVFLGHIRELTAIPQ